MKLNKKELRAMTQTYRYWKNDDEHGDFFKGLRTTLVLIGALDQVENQIFTENNWRSKDQIETAETLIKKAYDKKHKVDLNRLDDYVDDIKYMEKLTDEDKRVLAACIKYVADYK